MKLINRVKNILAGRKCRISLPTDKVREIIKKHNVSDWFFYSFANRAERRHICEPSLWLLDNVPKEKVIFETGCGCGFNLIWFAQKGFTRLIGSDISPEAIKAGKELAELANVTIELWQDDGLNPSRVPENIDVLLALNWTYILDNFELNFFLSTYSKNLSKGGVIVLEVIDLSYNITPNNQYLTSDWTKPVETRKPSEYKKRYSYEQIASIAHETGYEIYHNININQIIPRVVYLLSKN